MRPALEVIADLSKSILDAAQKHKGKRVIILVGIVDEEGPCASIYPPPREGQEVNMAELFEQFSQFLSEANPSIMMEVGKNGDSR